MTCREVLDQVEAVAGGDEATPAFRAHLERCVACAAALATARRIEAALAARPAPTAPARFSGVVLARVRRERWRAEQHVDRLFNAAVAFGIFIVVGGLAMLMNLSGLMGAIGGGLTVVREFGGVAVNRAFPVVPTYIAAGGFLATALLVWWWAERRWSM